MTAMMKPATSLCNSSVLRATFLRTRSRPPVDRAAATTREAIASTMLGTWTTRYFSMPLLLRFGGGWLNGSHVGADELPGVSSQVVGVGPQVTPDADGVRQRRGDDRRRERFEGDRPLVSDLDERPEEGGEVHPPRSQIATMALADVHVAESVAAGQHRRHHVGLLDV